MFSEALGVHGRAFLDFVGILGSCSFQLYLVFLVIITLMCFVGVPNRVLLGFVWCLWLCFPKALLLLLVMFFKALLMFVVIAFMGFVSVHGCCFFGLLVFVVIALLGFVGILGHAFLDSWCSWLCSLGLYWCSWSLFSWVLLVFMVMLSLFLLLFMW